VAKLAALVDVVPWEINEGASGRSSNSIRVCLLVSIVRDNSHIGWFFAGWKITPPDKAAGFGTLCVMCVSGTDVSLEQCAQSRAYRYGPTWSV
jgi:hypothetical protein